MASPEFAHTEIYVPRKSNFRYDDSFLKLFDFFPETTLKIWDFRLNRKWVDEKTMSIHRFQKKINIKGIKIKNQSDKF